jgi:hypothetical protein
MDAELYTKTLRLVMPETALSLNIPAEVPTFVSPMVSNPNYCRYCGITYSPLTYQTGQITEAQHYHEGTGGIYFWYLPATKPVAGLVYNSGFLAFVEPIGRIIKQNPLNETIGRADAVQVIGIRAYCLHSRHRTPHALESGILATVSPDLNKQLLPGQLLPHCEELQFTKNRHPQFRFTARDGTICISMI